MSIYYNKLLIIAAALMLLLGACSRQENPVNARAFKSHHNADGVITPPAKDKPKPGPVVLPEKSPQNGQDDSNAKLLGEKTSVDKGKEGQVGPPPPEFLPPPVPPLPPKPEGFVEYDGPVLSLCGNGVLDKTFNLTTCNPIAAPLLTPSGPCIPQLYIEQCDDGNAISNDGCSSACMKECCGNGIVEFGEQCDAGQRTGALPPNFSPPAGFPPTTIAPPPINPFPPPANYPAVPQSACSSTIAPTDVGNCSRHCQLIVCGDGVVNGNEECDDGNDQCCDGCFKCRLELPNTCPCNCVPPNVRCPDPSKPCPELSATIKS